jgi:hypothetical protein
VQPVRHAMEIEATSCLRWCFCAGQENHIVLFIDRLRDVLRRR